MRARGAKRQTLALALLGSGHVDLADKMVRLLSQIWLPAGPTCATMQQWLGSLRGSVFDFGVESWIADAPSALASVHGVLDDRAVPEPGSFLFRQSGHP